MKITVNRKALLSAWKTAAAAVPTKTPKDVLKSVKCEAALGVITLTATDCEVTIRVKVPGAITEEGACLLPADRVGSVLQAANAEDVSISTTESGIILQCGRNRVVLQTASVAEFPETAITTAPLVTLPASQFQGAIAFASTAISKGDSRFALQGIYFGVKNGRLVLAATDSRRLVSQHLCECPEFKGVVIPDSAVSCLKNAGLSGNISVSVSGTKVAVESDSVAIESRVLEGRWPEVALDFGTAGKSFATSRVAAGIWCGTWNQVKATLDAESFGADCQFGESINLTHRSAAGESEASCPCEFTGEPQKMRFSVDLVIPSSKGFEPTDILEIEAADPNDADSKAPVVLRAKCGDRMFLLMCLSEETK